MKDDAIVELIARELANEHDSGDFDRLLKTSILPHDSQATEKLRRLRRRAAFILTALRSCDLDVLPMEASEEMWSNALVSAIMMWLRQDHPLPRQLYANIEFRGLKVPPWVRAEIELQQANPVPSKGTCAAILYRAMTAAWKDKL